MDGGVEVSVLLCAGLLLVCCVAVLQALQQVRCPLCSRLLVLAWRRLYGTCGLDRCFLLSLDVTESR